MCGIIHVRTKKKGRTIEKVLDQYNNQKTRGSEGFGFCAIDVVNETVSHQRNAYWERTKKELKEFGAPEIMFHHRFPTSTINIKECAHPIKVKNKELKHVYYVVHNGIIRNDDELKTKHEKLGYVYNTEVTTKYHANGVEYDGNSHYNDSEALAVELARFTEGKSTDIKAKGSIAFIMLECNHKGKPIKLHYGRNWGNPLKVHESDKEFMLSSEGKGTLIPIDEWNEYDYASSQTRTMKVDIGDNGYNTTTSYNRPTYTGGTTTRGYSSYHDHSQAMKDIKALSDTEEQARIDKEDEDVSMNGAIKLLEDKKPTQRKLLDDFDTSPSDSEISTIDIDDIPPGFDNVSNEDYNLIDDIFEIDTYLAQEFSKGGSKDLSVIKYYEENRLESWEQLSEYGKQMYNAMK